MKTLVYITVLALIAGLTFVLTSRAAADHPHTLLVAPSPDYSLPKFGFRSFNIAGYGERITFVRWGGLAAQLGLEPGDVILRLNGYPLTYRGAWHDALSQAMASGDWIRLTIRDVRTGTIAYRQTFLGTPGHGPLTPKSHVVGYAGPPAPHAGLGAHPAPHGGPAPLLKQIAKMLDKD